VKNVSREFLWGARAFFGAVIESSAPAPYGKKKDRIRNTITM